MLSIFAYVIFGKKTSIQVICLFFDWVVCFFDICCMGCLYILEINSLVMSFVDIFSHSVSCLFVDGFLCWAKSLSLIRSHLSIFAFIYFALGD